MLGYYVQLAVRSLRRNPVLTTLMIAAVAVGIGTSMTMLTTLRAASGDPIPDKSSKLFVPQIDVWGPEAHSSYGVRLPDQVTYRDAMALIAARRGVHQTAMYKLSMDVSPARGKPFNAAGRAVYADFFNMFEVPFASGGPWSPAEDSTRANVVVLGAKLAGRAFPGINPVGKSISLDARDFIVIGVLRPWSPVPLYYDTTNGGLANGEEFFLPFTVAIDREIHTSGYENCVATPPEGWAGLLNSECVWLQYWVELPTSAAQRNYRTYLYNYASEQRVSGRFRWPTRVELHDIPDWLVLQKVVPEDVRINMLIGMGFLTVCLINAVGLMLAKFGSRARELGVRRALGGSRSDIFIQCVVETGMVGLLGGLFGLGLTAGGLAADRALLAPEARYIALDSLTRLDTGMVGVTLVVAVCATICAGLYPTLRASRVQPSWQLKAE